MESSFITILIIVGYVAWFLLRSFQKQARENQARGESSDNSENNSDNFFDTLRRALEAQTAQNQPQSRPAPQVSTPVVEDVDSDHFSEERIVAEYTRTHAEGKTISHHTHDYFDETKDAQVSRRQKARKAKHPLMKKIKGPNGLRDAILLSEIMKRRF